MPENGGANCISTPGSNVTFEDGVMAEVFEANCNAPDCGEICTCSPGNCVGKENLTHAKKAGPIAEQSKSSDLDCGRGNPGSNPGEGRNFFYFL